MLDLEVYYVQGISNGSLTIAQMAGMSVQADSTTWPLPAQVINVRTKPGSKVGSVYLIWKAVAKRKGYMVERLIELPDEHGGKKTFWQTAYTGGKISCTIEGLVSRALYVFRVTAFNTKGNGPSSPEVQGSAA